ncbi:VOC family protein [Paenibacillus sp. SC116]|uniref:VOC family protein n=1 Tax=Paenibacillus sp. SC116 TaxID=2968986 RepID=UPI00215B4393|nr:VOC family protein [Paenibacillus sp. SC116]MCR8845066.1 VOC family protein [Paenibacillus sp. SC116]
MSIGAFSVSLTVKDIQQSKQFYEKIGFHAFTGDITQNWLIMQNGDCTIGLFQGMFDKNILTFNPGWNNKAEEINPFKDVRELQEEFRSKGIPIINDGVSTSEGPASFVIEDPDGNSILIDQHR